MTNIAIISAWSSSYQSLADITIANRQAYCDKHGYHLIAQQLDTPGGRSSLWGRGFLALQHLSEYDWVWMLDADALIANHDIKIESLLPNGRGSGPDLLISQDINGANTASVFIKNTSWAKAFLQKWWSIGAVYARHGWSCEDQTSMVYSLILEPQENWGVLAQRAANSYMYSLYGMTCPEGEYHPGDFVLHLPVIDNPQRIQIFNQILESRSRDS